ncbi:MAG: hypothetical protein HC880_13925 [Bacteroidia bacterium]|nr:hypothetical protein [Bacteroidia bacterium]
MMKHILLHILLFACFLLSQYQQAVAQSGWVREKHSFYAKLGYSTFNSDNYFTLAGAELNSNAFRQHTLSFYGEYGLLNRLTVIANFPFLRFNRFERTEQVSAIGDLRLEFKYGLLQGAFPVAISIAPEFPTAPADNFATNLDLPSTSTNLPTGDGEFNIWTTIAASHSFHPLPLYLSIFSAYNFRTEYEDQAFRDQLQYGVEAGYQLFKRIWLLAGLKAQHSVGEAPEGVLDILRGEGTEFTTYRIATSLDITPQWSLSAEILGYNDWLADRRNIFSAPVYGFGVVYSGKLK